MRFELRRTGFCRLFSRTSSRARSASMYFREAGHLFVGDVAF